MIKKIKVFIGVECLLHAFSMLALVVVCDDVNVCSTKRGDVE